jgi:hypothetical protein
VTTSLSTTGRRRTQLVLFLTLAALLLRGVVLVRTVEVPGDGPSRATLAYEWSRHPYLAKAGPWPPGFMYLAGTFGFAVENPLVSSRILNVILGTLTVPFLYLLIDGIYGAPAAVFSAAALVVFPLHVDLSTTSLTEVSVLFELVAGLELLRRAALRRARHIGLLVAAGCCLILAEMTRYEAWLLAAPLPMYLYLKTRSRTSAGALAVALAAFPIAWTYGNAVYFGDAFAGFRAATSADALGNPGVGLPAAWAVLAGSVAGHFGWILATAIVSGLLLATFAAVRAKLDVDPLLYLTVTGIYWLTMLAFAVARGESLYNRYLLLGFIISLPFAALPFVATQPDDRHARAGVMTRAAAIVLGALVMLPVVWGSAPAWPQRRITTWVTREQPLDVERFTGWLADQRPDTSAIIATEMGWRSTYLPLYRPALAAHFAIVSEWHEDLFIQRFLLAERPALLVTTGGDERHLQRIERLLGATIGPDRLVYEADGLRAYALGEDVYGRVPGDRKLGTDRIGSP